MEKPVKFTDPEMIAIFKKKLANKQPKGRKPH